MNVRVLVILMFICFNGQAQINLDSLWKLWKNKNLPDSVRLNAMSIIAWDGYLYTKPDSAKYFANLEYKLALKLKNKKGQAQALSIMGTASRNMGDFPSAIKNYMACLKIEEQLKNNKRLANILINIGFIYKDQGDFEKAMIYFNQALDLARKAGDKEGMANVLGGIGGVYESKQDYKRAIDFYEQGLAIKREINDLLGESYFINNIATVYGFKGEHLKALKYFEMNLELCKSTNDLYVKALSLLNIGISYHKTNEPAKGIPYAEDALALAQSTGIIFVVRDAVHALYEMYCKTKNFEKALYSFKHWVKLRDSIQGEESQNAVLQNEIKYNYEKKAAADSVKAAHHKRVSDAQLARDQTTRYVLIGGFAFALVLGTFLVQRFRVTSRQKRVIEIQKTVVEEQKMLVEEKQKEVLDSIRYARRIQLALLPSIKYIEKKMNLMRYRN